LTYLSQFDTQGVQIQELDVYYSEEVAPESRTELCNDNIDNVYDSLIPYQDGD